MRFFRTYVLALVAGTSLILAGCGNDAGSGANGGDGETTTLRVGFQAPMESSSGETLEAMHEAIKEQTDGRVELELYPSGELGGEVEVLEQVQTGSVEGAVIITGTLSTVAPVLGGIDLPYLFDDLEHARASMDGELGAFIAETLAEESLLAWGMWDIGYKNLTNSVRPIQSAEDTDGISLRTLENSVLVETYSALGMDPTPLPWPETYTALQQGVVDGYEGTYEGMVSGGIHEVQPYVSEVGMIYSGVVLLLSEEALEGLSDEDRETVLAVGEEHAPQQRASNDEYNEYWKQEAIDYGIEIVEADEVDIDSFREATESVREDLDRYSELLELADASR